MGFLWFGTKDGLNRFDGHYFKVFRKTGKPGSIGNNFIHALYEDEKGILWIGTEGGVYQYTNLTETFTVVKGTENTGVSEIVSDKYGDLWFTSGMGLMQFSPSSHRLRTFPPSEYFDATGICRGSDGHLWVSTANGLLQKYNREKDQFAGVDVFNRSGPVSSRWIERITALEDGRILVGTSVAGVKLFDPRDGRYTDINVDSRQKDLFVRNFLQTSEAECWVGTEYGVYVYNLQTGNSFNYSKKYNDPFALSDNAVYSFCKDKEGGIWVGTYFSGINYYPPGSSPFKKYFPKMGENSLSGNVVREIKGDKKGNLWIGTEDAGLNKLDGKTGQFTHFKTGQGIAYPNIHGLLVTDDEIWIGTFEHGLDIMDARSRKIIRHYDKGPASGLNSNFIYCITQCKDGTILVGTTIGLYRFNRPLNRFDLVTDMPLYNWYTTILEAADGTIWAGTYGNGIHYMNPATKQYGTLVHQPTVPSSIKSNRINYILEDSDHLLWFATEEGLSQWRPMEKAFKHYTVNNGLPCDYMISLQEDAARNLWISTTCGLVKMEKKTDKLRVYSLSHGLLTNQFNFNSAYKDSTGTLYFGSAKGMISFQPSRFNGPVSNAPLYITGFQVNNEEIAIAGKEPVITKSISHTSHITLAHNQSTFSIDFAALSFVAPDMQEYAYQLEGLDHNWTYIKGNRRIYFTDLSPGYYTFKVKSSGGNSVWNSKETQLAIEILPPWWASIPAYISYGLLLLFAVIYIVTNYNRRQAEKNKRKLELLEIAKEKEIMQAKIEFFTNVAHEIKTPLTLIKVPLAKVIKKTEGVIPELENSLRIMDKNTNRLIELTQQLLDFRQTEINQFQLSFVNTPVSELVNDAYKSFSSFAEQNNISLSLQLPPQPIYAYIDAEAFHKIIYNLYSNAIKYADKKAEIEVLPLTPESTYFTILFKNDGHLIPDNQREKIFQPFYRIKKTEHQNGTGIGLALALSLTQLHRGYLELQPTADHMNVFELRLPVHQETEFNLKNGNKPYP
jgi:ligand-binding sensor domain-containing protein/signal transduction histidine kinase